MVQIQRSHQPDAELPAAHQQPACPSSSDWADTKLESTVRYLGIEVDDALEIAEQTEV